MRSALFVPGDQLHLIDKLRHRPVEQRPDQLVVDLEDGVAPSAKADARSAVAGALASRRFAAEMVVRVNAGRSGLDDLSILCASGDPIICVPKAEERSINDVIGAIADMGRTPRVWALVESAAGLRDLDRIASLPGVVRLALGEVDLCAELGVRPGAMHALWPLRMQLVAAAALAGLPGPIGPVSTDFVDVERYEHESLELRDAGFAGRLAIHPGQLSIIHRVFTPSPDELENARRLLGLFDAAAAAGRGAIVDDDGRMVDEAVARAARRLLATTSEEEP